MAHATRVKPACWAASVAGRMPAYWAHTAIQPELTEQDCAAELVGSKDPLSGEHRSDDGEVKLQAKTRLNRPNRPAKANCATMPTLRQYLKDPCTEHRNCEYIDGPTGVRVTCGGSQGAHL